MHNRKIDMQQDDKLNRFLSVDLVNLLKIKQLHDRKKKQCVLLEKKRNLLDGVQKDLARFTYTVCVNPLKRRVSQILSQPSKLHLRFIPMASLSAGQRLTDDSLIIAVDKKYINYLDL